VLSRISVLTLLLVCCAQSAPRPTAPPLAALPAVELTALDGARQRIEQVLDGRVGVISLWATWCDACARELDALERLDERAATNHARVVAISVGERREQVAAFVKWRGLHVAQLVDEEFHFADALGQRRVPTTLVVDRSGRIRFVGGALDESALAALRTALAEPVAIR
jgi:peroxiredoxin